MCRNILQTSTATKPLLQPSEYFKGWPKDSAAGFPVRATQNTVGNPDSLSTNCRPQQEAVSNVELQQDPTELMCTQYLEPNVVIEKFIFFWVFIAFLVCNYVVPNCV